MNGKTKVRIKHRTHQSSIELTEKATETLKDILRLKGDNISLYTLVLINRLENKQ